MLCGLILLLEMGRFFELILLKWVLYLFVKILVISVMVFVVILW